jgi:hypothetical protein
MHFLVQHRQHFDLSISNQTLPDFAALSYLYYVYGLVDIGGHCTVAISLYSTLRI